MSKHIKLFLAMMIISIAGYSQTYTVSVCGTVNGLNGGVASLDLQYTNGGQTVLLNTTTSPVGGYCFNFTVSPDSGIYAFTDISVTESSCFLPVTYSLGSLWISSDTVFTLDLENCGDPSGGNCFDPNQVDTNGVCPAVYAPVCGCDGMTYDNSCEAYYRGVISWTDGVCGGTTLCGAYIYEVVDSADGSVSLYADATGTAPFAYQWSTDEITQSILPSAPGQYCLSITDADGCSSTTCYDFGINTGDCYVYIYEFPDSQNTSVYLYADAYGTAPLTYEWTSGGQVLSETGNTLAPNAFGEYCVTVTDSVGCVSYACYLYGSTNGNCSVYFYSELAPTLPPGQQTTYLFYSFPSGTPPFTYNWSFSDGSTDTSANPVHTFWNTGGWDWAYVEVMDSTGCLAYYSDYVFFDDSTWVQSCYADFWIYLDDISGIPGQASFYDYSYGSTGTVMSWSWDFGDGSTSTLQNPTHIYSTAGDYTICLTITDASGCTSSTCWTYYIDPYWWLNNPGGGNGNACAAGFVATQDSAMQGMVYLVDLSYGSNLAYSWDFGNGTIVNEQYPYLTFTNEGWVYVCLTVTDTLTGCSNTFCDTVAVDENGYLRDGEITWSINVIPGLVDMLSSVGVDEHAANTANAALYPNPVNDILNLQIFAQSNEEVSIEMFDVTGKIVSSGILAVNKGLNTQRMNVQDITDGVYFVKLTSAGMNETLRFVKTH